MERCLSCLEHTAAYGWRFPWFYTVPYLIACCALSSLPPATPESRPDSRRDQAGQRLDLHRSIATSVHIATLSGPLSPQILDKSEQCQG
ncbi:hypothetical protein N657DRAFT_419664 [Parathielavia appendiculata]|uniref:Uncharacterized protein n=1 Tax=Parathielavia appendiculata TaxID=2587402 RepID=A0AAN6Z4C3_9PEZI|nr:hypothetical protein N657DRAFT_419664 [Parathielavia appendiculata]